MFPPLEVVNMPVSMPDAESSACSGSKVFPACAITRA